MAANYTTALKDSRMDLVDDAINVSQPGELHIANSTDFTGANLLTTIVMNNPAFGASASGVLTMASAISDTSADNTGTAAQARIQDGAAADVITGLTVASGSGDIDLDSVSITQAQTVTINTATITHA